jgi:GntR family uxuAB operon transcriptional repressor
VLSNVKLLAPNSPPRRSFEIVARQITALIKAEYEIGDRLPAERELAKTFGVSRPTIREALLSLQMAGVVQVRTNSGAYVLSRQGAAEVLPALEGFGPFENLQARQLIEPQIAALAAQHATDTQLAQLAETLAAMRRDHAAGEEADVPDHRFHVVLAEATGNGVLVTICDGLWRGQIESRIWQEIHTIMPMESYRPIWLADHEAIFHAVEHRNAKAASTAMMRHLTNIRNALMQASRGTSLSKA